MNSYKKYFHLNYETLSEKEMMGILKEMMGILDEVFDIDSTHKKGIFDEEAHCNIMAKIIKASLKLNYKTVCNELRKIYPITFPEFEKNFH